MRQKQKLSMPLIPLRGLTIFPNMVIHFDVGREKSIASIEEAMMNTEKIFLITQKDIKIEEPTESEIYTVGTICKIKQILKLPGNTIRVLVEGETRAKLLKYIDEETFISCEVREIKEIIPDDVELEALVRILEKSFESYASKLGNIPQDIPGELSESEGISRYVDTVSSFLNLKQENKQDILETIDLGERIEKLIVFINHEIEILKIENRIGVKVRNKLDKSQKDYYLREQIKVIQEELGEDEDDKKDIEKYREKIEKLKLPKEVKEKAEYELNKLKTAGNYSSESGLIKTYLDILLGLNYGKSTKEVKDIKKVREVLEADHFGLEDVKERIIEYISVRNYSGNLKGPIICLVGPPGVGKTSIAKSIARSLNRNFVRISLGGVRDEAEMRGHRRTYIGAIPGRFVYGIKEAKSNNPLFLLDEVDKLSSDFRGNPSDALLEILDGEQNSTFRDHYLEVPLDLSKVLFITTANSVENIPRPLLDRMELISISGYTYDEKFSIAKTHLIPKELKEHNVKNSVIVFEDDSIKLLIEGYTKESGVRNLERKVAAVIRKAITEIIEGTSKEIVVTQNLVKKYLDEPIYTYDKIDDEDKVGVVTGLAWTAYGGDTLAVEVSVMEGTGKLELTGQLGDVMKESGRTAYSYVRANAKKYDIDSDFYKQKDIHIHVPEGAVPKDGPSAGVTMTTAIASALSGKKIKSNVAMTGEVTLTGIVLPIGGLKEKSLAAYRAGIKNIIIPKDNEKDLKDIPDSIKEMINFYPVKNVSEVLEIALVK